MIRKTTSCRSNISRNIVLETLVYGTGAKTLLWASGSFTDWSWRLPTLPLATLPSILQTGHPPTHTPGPTTSCGFNAPCLCMSFSLPLLMGKGYSSCKVSPMCICSQETSPWGPGGATHPAFGCHLPRATVYHSSYHISGATLSLPCTVCKCSDQALLVTVCEAVPRAGWLPWLPVRLWGEQVGGHDKYPKILYFFFLT